MPRKKAAKASKKVNTPNSKSSIERMKYEIASEFGVSLGASASSRDNGLVGGEITKRLVENGMTKSKSNSNSSSSSNSKSKSTSKKRTKKNSK